MRLTQFLAEYERELSKRRRPSSANGSVRRSLPGSRGKSASASSLKPKGRSKLEAHQQEQAQRAVYPEGEPTFEDQLDRAIRKSKLKIQLEGLGNQDGRIWNEKAEDRAGVKKIDDAFKKSPDKQSALALREIQLTAQGNVQRLSAVIRLAKDIRVVESGIGSAGGHIARELGSPGPINGHNLVRPWEKNHTDFVSEAQTNEILVAHKDIVHPVWDHNHVVAKVLSQDVPPEKVVRDPLFLQEIQHFRHPDLVPRSGNGVAATAATTTVSSLGRPTSAPARSKKPGATTDATSIRDQKQPPRRSYIEVQQERVDSMLGSASAAAAADSSSSTLKTPFPGASPTTPSQLSEAQNKWTDAVRQMRSAAKELVYKDLTELTALREPPETLANLVAYVCILLGLQPTWQAAKRALFKELVSLQNFLTEVDPLTIPVRRLRKASELRDAKLSFLTSESLSLYSKSLIFEKFGLWVLTFDAIARIIIAVEDARSKRLQESETLPQEPGTHTYAYPIITQPDTQPAAYGILTGTASLSQPPDSPNVLDMRKSREHNRILYDQIKEQEDAKVPSRVVAEARKKYRNAPKVIEQNVTIAKLSKFDLRPHSAGAMGSSRKSKAGGGGRGTNNSTSGGSKSSQNLVGSTPDGIAGAGAGAGAAAGSDQISSSNIDVLAFFQTLAADDSLLGSWSKASNNKHGPHNSPSTSPFRLMAQAAAGASAGGNDQKANRQEPQEAVPAAAPPLPQLPPSILKRASDNAYSTFAIDDSIKSAVSALRASSTQIPPKSSSRPTSASGAKKTIHFEALETTTAFPSPRQREDENLYDADDFDEEVASPAKHD